MKSLGKVLDISKFQGKLTQDAISKIKANGVVGVILRIGFTGWGSCQPTMDSCFEYNYNLLHNAGINCGAYYFTLCYNDVITNREIEWLKKELAKKKFELPIYIDVEKQDNSVGWASCSATVMSRNVAKICKALEDEKYYVGIYASKSWFGTHLIESVVAPYDKWIAQYFIACTYKGTYHLWQYTSSANPKTYGITGNKIDVSECYLDFPTIIKNKELNGYKKVKEVICPYTNKKCIID